MTSAEKFDVDFKDSSEVTLRALRIAQREHHARKTSMRVDPLSGGSYLSAKVTPEIVEELDYGGLLPGYIPVNRYGVRVPMDNEVGSCECFRFFTE